MYSLFFILSHYSSVSNNNNYNDVHPFLEYIESIIGNFPKFYEEPSLSLLTYR
jgi:hypothetical protein